MPARLPPGRRTSLSVPHRLGRPRRLAGAIEDALLHYWIGHRTAAVGLPVAWDVVAQRMAEALEGAVDGEQEQEVGR